MYLNLIDSLIDEDILKDRFLSVEFKNGSIYVALVQNTANFRDVSRIAEIALKYGFLVQFVTIYKTNSSLYEIQFLKED